MPSTFRSKENFAVGDVWLTDNAATNVDNLNDESFGSEPVPYNLAALIAHPVFGNAGTGKPNNGASANDAAFAANKFVLLGDGSKAEWNGTGWVIYS